MTNAGHRRLSVAVAAVTLAFSLLLVDLFPGFAVVAAVAVGVAAVVQARRSGAATFTPLAAIFAGLVLAIVVVLVLALVQS